MQLIIGAFVSGMNAGTIYNTWPLMGVSYFPDDSKIIEFLDITVFDNPSIVQFLHRFSLPNYDSLYFSANFYF